MKHTALSFNVASIVTLKSIWWTQNFEYVFYQVSSNVVASLFFIGIATRNLEKVQTQLQNRWKSMRSVWICFHGAVDITGIISVFSLIEVLSAQAVHSLIYSTSAGLRIEMKKWDVWLIET